MHHRTLNPYSFFLGLSLIGLSLITAPALLLGSLIAQYLHGAEADPVTIYFIFGISAITNLIAYLSARKSFNMIDYWQTNRHIDVAPRPMTSNERFELDWVLDVELQKPIGERQTLARCRGIPEPFDRNFERIIVQQYIHDFMQSPKR